MEDGDVGVEIDTQVEIADLKRRVQELEANQAHLRQVEAALRESELKLRRLTDNMLDLVTQVDADLTIEYASPSHERLLGYPPESLLGQPVLHYLHPDDRPVIAALFAAASQTGADVRVEYRCRHRDGHYLWLESIARPLRDETGQLVGGLIGSRDITARKQAEDELQRRETYFRTLIENTSDIITLIDDQGIIRYESPSALAVLGYTPEERVGRNAFELIHPDDLAFAAENLQRRWSDPNRPERIEMRVRHKDGSWRTLDVTTSSPIHVGDMRGIVSTSRDVTERKRIEHSEREQREFAEALRDIAAALTSTLQLNEVLDRILESVGHVVPHDTGSIMLIEGDQARIVRCRGFAERGLEERVLNFALHVSQSPNLQQMIETRQPLILPDTHNNPEWVRYPGLDWIRAYLAAPIYTHGNVIGFLNLDSATAGFFTPEHAERLLAFAHHAAVAIENARLLEATQQRANELAALYRASAAFLNTTDLQQVADHIAAKAIQEFSQTHCSVMLLDEATQELRAIAQRAQPGMEFEPFPIRLDGPGLIAAAARSGEIVYARDVHADPRYLKGNERTESELAIPLRARGRVIGVLNMESERRDAFSEGEQRVLAAFAERAELALYNALLFEQIEQSARHLAHLNALTRRALEISDSPALLDSIADLLVTLLASDSASISLWDEESQRIVAGGSSEAVRPIYATIRPEPGEPTATGTVMRTRQTLVEEDAKHSAYISARIAAAFPARAFIAVPLVTGHATLGAAIFMFHRPHRFTRDEIERAEQAASQVALAVANGQLLQRLRQARQTAEEANRLKSEFLANTSHELRTPLSGIMGSLKLILDDLCASPEEERAFVRAAYEAAQKLLGIINDLLDTARIEAGKLEIAPQPVDIRWMIHDVMQLCRAQAEQKGISLRAELPPGPLPLVQADPDRARQVLLNLIGNAIKFTDEGGVTVELLTSAEESCLCVRVIDTGIGIPFEAQPRLFQPFMQVDGSTTRRYGGTGLGLSISRRLAELMGGSLTLYSAGEGTGCTFTFKLPLASSAA